jgi:hypothetical protein
MGLASLDISDEKWTVRVEAVEGGHGGSHWAWCAISQQWTDHRWPSDFPEGAWLVAGTVEGIRGYPWTMVQNTLPPTWPNVTKSAPGRFSFSPSMHVALKGSRSGRGVLPAEV